MDSRHVTHATAAGLWNRAQTDTSPPKGHFSSLRLDVTKKSLDAAELTSNLPTTAQLPTGALQLVVPPSGPSHVLPFTSGSLASDAEVGAGAAGNWSSFPQFLPDR